MASFHWRIFNFDQSESYSLICPSVRSFVFVLRLRLLDVLFDTHLL